MTVVELAHHGGMSAAYRTQDAAFGAAVGTDGANFDQHTIAVHGGAYSMRRDENIARDS